MLSEWLGQIRTKIDQGFDKTIGAYWALYSTRNELKNKGGPFAVSKRLPVKASNRPESAKGRRVRLADQEDRDS